jgi:hypothetical protein
MELPQATANGLRVGLVVFSSILFTSPVPAQELDPRSYARVPVDITFGVVGFSYLVGGVVTDAASPIQDMHATVGTPSLGVSRTFGLFGKTAQAFAAVPYSWARATGLVVGEAASTSRSGLSDPRVRFSVLLSGAPARTVNEFSKTPRQLIFGTSLTVVLPLGQYYPEKVINLGTNRWAFKPEIALSYPVDEHWLLDFYAGVWLFTDNTSFYPGNATRSQDPLAAFQGHVIYEVTPQMWMALDMTFYAGGVTSVNGVNTDDRQNNVRVGGTVLLPVGERHSVKLACSTGAIVRFGANFTNVAIGWQTVFF